MPHLIPPTTPAAARTPGGISFNSTVIAGVTVVWCRAGRHGEPVVQAVNDPGSTAPARRVTDSGVEPLPGENRGLTVYGSHSGDRPAPAEVASFTPEYTNLMTDFEDGEGTTTFAGGPEALLPPADVAIKLGVSVRTVHKYHTDGRLPRAEQYTGRTPLWPQAVIDEVVELRRGPGRPPKPAPAV